MLCFHLRKTHKITIEAENRILDNIDRYTHEITEAEKTDDIVIMKTGRAETNIKIFCRSCGELIGLTDLITPTVFKSKYGENCLHCGAKLGKSFQVKRMVLNPS